MRKPAVKVIIDGRPIEVAAGTSIIQAADALGVYIPRFCYHPKLSVVAQCRMCLVEVEGVPRPLPACSTPVADQMVVKTASPLAVDAQKGVLEFLLLNHPLDCPICDQGGECPLQDITLGFGETYTRNEFRRRTYEKLDISPFIEPEMNRCIHCTRCIRFSDEIDGGSEFGFIDRGDRTKVEVYREAGVAVKSTLSGNVIDICPVGALTDKPYRFSARVWEMSETTNPCLLCPIGCRSLVWTRENQIKRITAGEQEAVNECWICDAGRFGMELVGSPRRLRGPLLRRGGRLEGVPWEVALKEVAKGLLAVKEAHGPQAIAGIGGARGTNEGAYLFQKLLRGVLGTNHVDARTHPAEIAATDALIALRGFPGLEGSIAGLEGAPAFFLFGSDLFYEHPVLAIRVRKAVQKGRARLILAHPRRVSLNLEEDVRLQYAPGRDRALVLGLLKALSEGQEVPETLGEILEGCEVAPMAAEAGVQEEALRRAAEALSGVEGPVLLMGPGVLDPRAAPLFAALGLLLPTARLGYLSPAGNLQGALDMGCLPGRLPGYASFDGGPQALSETLGFKSPTWPGEDTEAILEGARAGRIKALYLLGADPLRDYPDFALVREALSRLELLVTQDILPPLSMEFASAVLPNRAVTETQGSITNLERRVQGLRVAVRAPEAARADWEIFQGLAQALGVSWRYRGLKDVQEEIARAVPPYHAMISSDLLGEGFQWSPGKGGPDPEELLREVREPALAEAPGSSLILLTSPHLFASGPWVAESRAIRSAGPPAFAELHPETARALGVVSGDLVEVSSKAGRISVTVKVDGKTPPRAVYVPSGVGEEPSNLLQGRSSLWPSVQVKGRP